MTDPKKKPPNLPARIEADVGRDLRAVGGFFKGLFKFTEKAEKAIEAGARAAREEPRGIPRTNDDAERRGNVHPEGESAGRREFPIARAHDGTEVLPKCDVCGDTKTVGGARKVPCPACAKVR